MSITAMKQALEALNKNVGELRIAGARHILRTAIAEAEKQEPVAWLYLDAWGTLKLSQIMPPPTGAFPVYTTPPAARREWVGLTDEQINQYDYQYRDILYDVEKMLRENNA